MTDSWGAPRWVWSIAGLLPLILIAALLPVSVIATPALAPASLQQEAEARSDLMANAAGRTDRVLIRWSTRLSATTARAPARLAALASGTGRKPAFVRFTASGAAIYDLGAPLGADAPGILAALRKAEGVATAEPDLWMTADTLPSDPLASELWGLLGAADGASYGIDAPGAWARSTGSGVIVAVIDTGLAAHEDLAGQSVAGYDMFSVPALDNDGNPGRDANASDPGDWCYGENSSWHGTHIAGTIAALSNNSVGVFGGSPGVKIQPVRVLGTCGGFLSDVADGIRWAAGGSVPGVPANTTPARVLNLSLGGPGDPCPDELSSAISDARSHGAVVVVAAGNEAADASSSTPANCNGVIAVAATNQAGQRAPFSNYGSVVDLAAPGVSILSTVDSGTTVPAGSTYASYSGTSMAAPHVALTAALVAAAAPSLTPAQIETILAETSTPFGADTSATGCPALGCGAGIVNASRAVATARPPDTTGPSGSVSIDGGAVATLSRDVSVSVPAWDVSGVSQVRLSNNAAMAGALTDTYSTPQDWTLAAGPDGTRTVYVQWQDGVGNWSAVASDSITLQADTTAPAVLAPAASLVSGVSLGMTTVPVHLVWSVSDAGAGITHFDLELSTNGGSYVALTLPSPTATTLSPLLSAGNATYRFRVRAIDAAGNASSWAAGPIFHVGRAQESSHAIRYGGIWSTGSSTAALGGHYRSTTRARASVSYTFTGRSVAWVARRGAGLGYARIYIDGVYRRSVNLRASSTLWRQLVFSRTWASSGRHTIRIVGSGTAGHPRVDLDAFVVLW